MRILEFLTLYFANIRTFSDLIDSFTTIFYYYCLLASFVRAELRLLNKR